jgi:putative endopeptidase
MSRLASAAALAASLALADGGASLAEGPLDLLPLFATPAAQAAEVGPTAGTPGTASSPRYGAWGFDRSGMDTNARPGDSFFEFANGGWVAGTPIAPDKTRAGMFEALIDKTQDQLLAIIEAAAKSGAAPDSPAGKIGALYRAYMDEARLDMLDSAPIAGDLDDIRAARTGADIAVLMGRARGGFGPALFGINVTPDEKDPDRYAVYVSQSGLGLPDRDYYLRDTYRAQLAAYRDYATRLLGMIGWPDARRCAEDAVNFESRIAEASWSRIESRNRDKSYNPMTPAELAALAPEFPWVAWLGAAKIDESRLVVRQYSAFPKLAKVFAETPIETLQAWHAFRLVDQAAPYLSGRFSNARFAFRGAALTGQPEERSRIKRAVGVVDGALSEAVGSEYVTRYFPPQSKARMEELVRQLETALAGRIERLTWMTAETKARALEKLSLINVKIGYPNVWRDYSALKMNDADLVGDIRRSNAFKWDYALGHLGKPVDREEWNTSPQVVNAFYGATRAEIVFPAAILQPPFFDPNADMAINYGGIGGVIGHELTHGFDDQGRKSDGHGMLTDWWQVADAARFEIEAGKLRAQYDTYEVAPGLSVKGAQTIGENIADLGGILLALDAYRASLGGKPSPILDGYSGEQRVFLGWAQVWRAKLRPEAQKQQIAADSHAPARFRVDGPLRNVDGWYEAWNIQPGDLLYLKPEDRIRIW